MVVWQLQEAKNKFSEVVESAMSGEPQIITRRGEEVVVVLAIENYRRLTTPHQRLVDALRNAPPGLDELEFSRSPELPPSAIDL